MNRFIDTAFGFPAGLFTFLLLAVAGYWLLVLLGAADLDDGLDALAGAVGFGGMRLALVATALVGLAWFASLTGAVLVSRSGAPAPVRTALSVLLVPISVAGGWLGARAVRAPLLRLLPAREQASRLDFVGRTCILRTDVVDSDHGQAEVAADDGSTAVIQVRLAGRAQDARGWTALIYGYEPDGEYFWITPIRSIP